MSEKKLDESKARFEQALGRLEKAVSAKIETGAKTAGASEAAVTQAAARTQALEAKNASVAQALDKTIERFRTILAD
ncbi:MAG: hypothetical protein O7A03_00945 [Alphaproteobacteria bacterium]|nr:hypothetical protein [Alphaproteobacteria bacterium]